MTQTVSALVVTYQHAAYVREAILSIRDQRPAVDEIVVVDDGSADGTLREVRAIVDSRIRVVELPHRGIPALADTFTAGLNECRGDLIAILEADDRWPAGKIARQSVALASADVVVSHGLYSVIGARGTRLHAGVAPHLPVPEGVYDARPFLLRGSYIMPVTAVMRRDALLRIGGFKQLPGTPHWDYPTFLALSELGTFSFERTILGDWRRHSASAVYRLTGRDLDGIHQSVDLALAARARMRGNGLPSESEIRQGWDEAEGHMVWQISRILLIGGRFGEVRRLVAPLLRRRQSLRVRARLIAAFVSALLHVKLEALVRRMRGRSVLEELD